MTTTFKTIAVLVLVGWLAAYLICATQHNEPFAWGHLPALPEAVSGQFAGVSNGALVVAGGAHYPVSLFQGGTKVWSDSIFILEPGTTRWRAGFKLLRPLAYGATVTTSEGIICIGGSDAEATYANVFRITWIEGKIVQAPLPDLPHLCSMATSALLNNIVYVAGGQDSLKPSFGMNTFWALDLSKRPLKWQALKPWPGPGRIEAVAATQDGAFYLLSGWQPLAGSDGKISPRYLTDAYRFSPRTGWTRIADLPKPVVGAPAIPHGKRQIVVFGGDNGENVPRIWELKEKHPGFSCDVLLYDTTSDKWTISGRLPVCLVDTTAVKWQKGVVVPGGEDRPGHRSGEVLFAMPRINAELSTGKTGLL
jgi:N-acetylneuraminic acid mutarotase